LAEKCRAAASLQHSEIAFNECSELWANEETLNVFYVGNVTKKKKKNPFTIKVETSWKGFGRSFVIEVEMKLEFRGP
jgi:hypothetical protein